MWLPDLPDLAPIGRLRQVLAHKVSQQSFLLENIAGIIIFRNGNVNKDFLSNRIISW
jgi:hypothetical protein